MSERITGVPKLADLIYAHTLAIKSTHEYNVKNSQVATVILTYTATERSF